MVTPRKTRASDGPGAAAKIQSNRSSSPTSCADIHDGSRAGSGQYSPRAISSRVRLATGLAGLVVSFASSVVLADACRRQTPRLARIRRRPRADAVFEPDRKSIEATSQGSRSPGATTPGEQAVCRRSRSWSTVSLYGYTPTHKTFAVRRGDGRAPVDVRSEIDGRGPNRGAHVLGER